MKNTFNIIICAAAAMSVAACTGNGNSYKRNTGFVFGTTYNIVYDHPTDLGDSILARLNAYSKSLSTFDSTSTISRINRNETAVADSFFCDVYAKALDMHRLSGGLFDITVAPLVKLWKFGGSHADTISVATYDSIASKVDSVLQFVGMGKTALHADTVVKSDPRISFEASAIAEGYGIDLAASVLDEHGVQNYMVEIGGEIHAKGINPKGTKWRIGIDRPIEKSTAFDRQLQHIISITDCAVSTSGSYRQFYYTADGRRLSHSIDPRTGHPIAHSMLSTTVVGPNTVTTDGLATSFMVMGPQLAIEKVKSMKGIEAYFIYEDEAGRRQEFMTDGFRQMIVE